MNRSELQKTAQAYEDLLVPALFADWADHVAESAAVQRGDRVLDVACGTGVLSRAVVAYAGETGSVTGVDPNPGMLSIARTLEPEVNWTEGTAESLPFDSNLFDVVLSQFGLMLFESPVAGLKEMYRVLKPEGSLRVVVFNSLQHLPAYDAIVDIYERTVGPSVAEALRVPFSMGDPDDLVTLFEQAGIHGAVVSTGTVVARFRNMRQMVLSDVKGWFPFANIHLDDQTINSIVERAEHELDRFIQPEGGVRFDVSAHMVRAAKEVT
ncbi:class I SAM-dependent methyltransferase [Longibacter salinarum]|nr:class I SAM-dependent methyltransferase [Longibacter salinarum]